MHIKRLKMCFYDINFMNAVAVGEKRNQGYRYTVGLQLRDITHTSAIANKLREGLASRSHCFKHRWALNVISYNRTKFTTFSTVNLAKKQKIAYVHSLEQYSSGKYMYTLWKY